MSNKLIISPVSIDLGAKNTGVYFAHYPAGSSIEDIEKEGKVYQLEKNNYTLLMTNRTARRHQRRGYDRRQMVKRLFKLIWVQHFGLEWDKNVQQATSFLFNRRGFSFLSEEYNAEILSRLPEEVYQLLPNELRIDPKNKNEYDYASALTEWGNAGETKVQECFDAILRQAYYEKIRRCCKEKKIGDVIKEGNNSVKLGDTPIDIFKEIFSELSEIKNRIETEEYTFTNNQNTKITAKYNKGETLNVLSFINNNDIEVANAINEKLPREQIEWLFNPVGNFDLEKSMENLTEPENIDIKLHLKHLAFALHKILSELQSGGRHRSKYFEEVSDVLGNKNHAHNYLNEFCIKKLQSGNLKLRNTGSVLKVDSLANLISHLSNLELKPLRKYFNDEKHKTGDYWDEARLKKIFDRWITLEWRINPEKDKDKAKETKGDYKKLCENWKAHNGTVVDFWLKTDPFYTIPPYQDNNNRRPPRCQSLVLNATYLDKHYPEWRQKWLAKLKECTKVQEHLDDFEVRLKNLQSGKGKSYFSDKTTSCVKEDNNGSERKKTDEEIRAGNSQRRTLKVLDARILQFIFDRVKADDPLKLNELYSHTKKYRQSQSTDEERENAKEWLEQAIKNSILPDTLKTARDYKDDAIFKQGSFLHLICKYYKDRQKAREGRFFIHPEYRHDNKNTGRFDDSGHLLTYCNHKPRQKRYQMSEDLASLLQVMPRKLEEFITEQGGETIDEKFNWLYGIKNLRTNCERAAKEQKERRGRLKLDIQNIYTEHNRNQREPKFYSFCERAKSLCLIVTQPMYDDSAQKQWKRNLEANPAAAVYLLAQINNLVFKERSGNASTCAVCSTDNALRRQMITSDDIKESHAKAQRLPAIETRLIDGAVMRMARIVGGAIADDKWERIKGELQAGKSVRVPIITESNRFEFEPNLKEIKGKKLSESEKNSGTAGQQKLAVGKDDRIKKASLNVCPYTGEDLSSNAGEIDHIIPRQSEWGTLNDETNLIWASRIGNHHKTNNHLSLSSLHNYYKNAQFPEMDDDGIKQWIIDQIGDGEGENFKFGPYRSFINLSQEQQKAFRHALFLSGSHPLRKKVIEAINNRIQTLVNGTQRYFAETLANGLYKKAKAINKQHLLSFDYFGVEAQDNTRGEGIYNLRKELVESYRDDLKEYDKENGTTQDPYSHLLDAQVAFCMIAVAHHKEGSLKLDLGNAGLWSRVDKKTGEVKDKKGKIYDAQLFNTIQVAPERLKLEPLERQNPGPKASSVMHRPLFNDNAVAMHFLKLIEIKEPNQKTKYLTGFLNLSQLKKCLNENPEDRGCYSKYADELNDRYRKKYLLLYLDKFAVGSGTGTTMLTGFGEKRVTVKIYSLDKKKVYRFLIDHFNTATDVSLWESKKADELKILKSLYRLWYFTQRQKIIVKDNNKETLYNLKADNEKCGRFINPQIEKAWNDLHSSIDNSQDLRKQLKDYFLNKDDNGQRVLKHDHKHKRVAKEFSLPISCQKGFLIRKKNWKGKDVYYCRPGSNDFSQTLLHKDQHGVIPDKDKDERLVNAYRQKNMFYCSSNFTKLKKELRPLDANLGVDPNKYYEAQIPPEFSKYICKVENRRIDAGRPRYRFYLKEKERMDFTTFKKFILKYPFRNLQDLRKNLKLEWVEGRIYDPDSLEKSIAKVEKMKPKPELLLPALKEIEKLFKESKKNKILSYSAKGKFTLSTCK